VTDALFRRDDDAFVPTLLTRSPWTPEAQHGGPPAALIARAVEALPPDGMEVVRITVELLGRIPVAPLVIEAQPERDGKRVQFVSATGRTPEGDPLLRASAWRVRRTDPLDLGSPVDAHPESPPPPEALDPFDESFRDYIDFFGSAVDKRIVSGNVLSPGRACVWFRLRVPVVAGEADTPLQRLMAMVDSANGISWAIPFTEYLYPNLDLGVYLTRPPQGEWIALDAVTYLDPAGRGISDTRIFDTTGFVGRSNQALFLEAAR
jgi:hypothetical protein